MLRTQAEEVIKCCESFDYFCANYIKLLHPLKGYVPFTLQPWQKRLVEELNDNRFVISKKWRSGGLSTTHMNYCVWQCLFHEQKKILWVSKTKHESEWWSETFSLLLKMLPEWMQPRMTHNNRRHKEFAGTKSHIIFTNPEGCRSHPCTHMVIDEAAFIPRMEWHWKVLWPCLGSTGKCYITSTVNHGGVGLWFTELFIGAMRNQNCFHVFESNYKEHPDHQNPEYVKALKEALGAEGWSQEMECDLFPTPKGRTIETESDPTDTI